MAVCDSKEAWNPQSEFNRILSEHDIHEDRLDYIIVNGRMVSSVSEIPTVGYRNTTIVAAKDDKRIETVFYTTSNNLIVRSI